MINNNKKRINHQSGQALLIAMIFFLTISLSIIAGLVSPAVRELKIADNSIKSKQSFFLAESGVEDAYYRLMNGKVVPETAIDMELNGVTASTLVEDTGFNEKTITSLGDISSRQRTNEIIILAGEGVSFSYGIQAGLGGFVLANNSTINGNVYSNGDIVGGGTASIVTGSAIAAEGSSITDIEGGEDGPSDVWAETVNGTQAFGNLYCTYGTGNTNSVGGNKSCDTSRGVPPARPFPISDEEIDEWKAIAVDGIAPLVGNQTITGTVSMGPKKIEGNLTVNGTLNLTGVLWVTGKISTATNATIRVDSSFGASGTIVIADGIIDLKNNTNFAGSGDPKSYVLLISTSTCPDSPCNYSGQNAIYLGNNASAVLLNAQNGTVRLKNGTTINEVVGYKVVLEQNTEINYLTGLLDTNFSTGPSGGWSIQNWGEK